MNGMNSFNIKKKRVIMQKNGIHEYECKCYFKELTKTIVMSCIGWFSIIKHFDVRTNPSLLKMKIIWTD